MPRATIRAEQSSSCSPRSLVRRASSTRSPESQRAPQSLSECVQWGVWCQRPTRSLLAGTHPAEMPAASATARLASRVGPQDARGLPFRSLRAGIN